MSTDFDRIPFDQIDVVLLDAGGTLVSLALAVMGCRPDRTLHVGDMYFADVVGARGAGLPAVLLDPYDDWLDVDCMRLPTVGSVRDLLRSARTSNRR